MDVFSDILARARARAAFLARLSLREPWSCRVDDPTATLTLYGTLHGTAWLRVPGPGKPVCLQSISVALARGRGHILGSTATSHGPDFARVGPTWLLPGEHDRYANHSDREHGDTVLVCGSYCFDSDIASVLLETLPPLVHLPTTPPELADVLRLLDRDCHTGKPGGQAAVDRLLDLVLVYALRTAFDQPGTTPPGWYRTLTDPVLAPALMAIHEHPARTWTIDDLAALAGLSRSAFARRFTASTDQPPLTYLTNWRMQLARDLLQRTDTSITRIARDIGYASDASFITAFKRHTGHPPAQWRTAQEPAH